MLILGLPSTLQAAPHTLGAFVSGGAAVVLESADRNGGPLEARGVVKVIEAGALVPVGTLAVLEVGARGATRATGDPSAMHEVGLLGGARVVLLDDPSWIAPFLRGGLSLFVIRTDETRAGVGSHLGAGIELRLVRGLTVAVAAVAHGSIAPFTVALGGSLTLIVGE